MINPIPDPNNTHMTNLDIEKGLLDLTGKVDCICYMTDKENGTFSIKRLFK